MYSESIVRLSIGASSLLGGLYHNWKPKGNRLRNLLEYENDLLVTERRTLPHLLLANTLSVHFLQQSNPVTMSSSNCT